MNTRSILTSPSLEPPKKLLTIAGSDSGGAAGLQADLKTWTAVRAYGMSVITAVTAQNSYFVNAVQFMTPDFVVAQLDAVLSDYGVDGIKTGFIGQADLIQIIAAKLQEFTAPHLVVDPVLVNHKGHPMFSTDVMQAYRQHLFPLAELITPNCREAEVLTGLSVKNVAEMETAARHLHSLGPQNILIKRGLVGDEIVDVLFDGATMMNFRSIKIDTQNTHGSGDVLSAATCAFLAKECVVETAVVQARRLTHTAIHNAVHWRLGAGHGPLAIFDFDSTLNARIANPQS
jgi:hydroxymethylpyrimidine/phosphomethylpyrimidine kinase